MKVALLVSGLIRGDYTKNVNRLQSFVPLADLFMGTWGGKDNIKDELGTIETFPEPEMHYHPGYEFTSPIPLNYQRFLNNKQAHQEKWLHRTKQILIHAYMLELIPREYDVIIRARFDTVLGLVKYNPLIDIIANVEETKTTHGFHVPRGMNNKYLNELKELEPNHSRSLQHLPDHLIIHHRSKFDPSEVFSMHRKKQLLPAEWGWYQVLGEPHKAYLGFAGLQ